MITTGFCAVYRARRLACRTLGYDVDGGGGRSAHGLSNSAGVHRNAVALPPRQIAFDPNVMLSPNASVLVFSRRGGAETVTLKLQETGGPETGAEQRTAVVPTANSDPLAGEHVEVTDGVPAVAGAVNVTTTGLLSGDTIWMGAGHVSVGGGPDGEFAQAAATISHETADSPPRTLARIY